MASSVVAAVLAWPIVQLAALTPLSQPESWLSDRVVALLQGCRLNATDGTVLFTPDASSSYGAQWTRDMAYAMMYAPVQFGPNGSDLLAAAVRYTFRGQRPSDGCMPDRVTADGTPVYSPGSPTDPFSDHALDNGPFGATLVATHWHLWADRQLFCELEPSAKRALQFPPRRDGLVYNDPASPNCTYGFTDTVAKQGHLLFTSLLLLQATRQMYNATIASGCGNSSWYAAGTSWCGWGSGSGGREWNVVGV